MISLPKEENNFVICVATFQQEGSSYPTPLFQSTNNGVSDEIIISQLEAYLFNLKKGYADEFDKSASKFKEE